jgi:hypothetical protein
MQVVKTSTWGIGKEENMKKLTTPMDNEPKSRMERQ